MGRTKDHICSTVKKMYKYRETERDNLTSNIIVKKLQIWVTANNQRTTA